MLNTITNVLTATSFELSSLLSNVTATTSTASVGDMLFALILGVVMGFLIDCMLPSSEASRDAFVRML